MKKRQIKLVKQIRPTIVLLFILLTIGGFFYSRFTSFGSNKFVSPTPTPKAKTNSDQTKNTKSNQSKYSNFQHKTHTNLKIACDSCHKVPTSNWNKVRSKDTAFADVTDYPQHQSCINCHRQQFFSGKTPAICANCHTNPSPNNSSRHPFPNPREIFDKSPKGKNAQSEFQISFPHDKHIEIVSQNKNHFEFEQNGVSFIKARVKNETEDSCKVCHQTYQPQGNSDIEFVTTPPKDIGDNFWLKKGTFKTSPIGHTICFTCHSTDTGIAPLPTNCATCHKPKESLPNVDFDSKLADKIAFNDKIMLDSWQQRDSSAKFQHDYFAHTDLSCATCHTVSTINTTEAKSKKVPILSCNPCHITATSVDGGILNTEVDSRKKDAKFDCLKCHLSYSKSAIPDSHIKAIASLGGK